MADSMTLRPLASFSPRVQALAAALAEDYAVSGPATHAGRTDFEEIAFMYPLANAEEGARLILIFREHHADEYIRLTKLQNDAKSEDEEQEHFDKLMDLGADPDENTMEPDEVKAADNGDGTYTFRTSVSLF